MHQPNGNEQLAIRDVDDVDDVVVDAAAVPFVAVAVADDATIADDKVRMVYDTDDCAVVVAAAVDETDADAVVVAAAVVADDDSVGLVAVEPDDAVDDAIAAVDDDEPIVIGRLCRLFLASVARSCQMCQLDQILNVCNTHIAD